MLRETGEQIAQSSQGIAFVVVGVDVIRRPSQGFLIAGNGLLIGTAGSFML